MKIKRFLSWEDAILVFLTSLWVAMGYKATFFHLYTVGVMGLILSLGLSRGLRAVLIRTAVLSVIVLLLTTHAGQPYAGHITEVIAMMACAGLAGILGDKQRKAQEALTRSFSQTLEGLAHALEARDPYTEGHSRRTSEIAGVIAKAMGVDAEGQKVIRQAGILHDLGKIGTPDGILRKNGSLTHEEKEAMQQHPVIGHRILEGIGFLRDAATLVKHHHERYDGSGYPDGLSHSGIPLGARILAVADALDALTTDRPYHNGIEFSEAVQLLKNESGHQFDPAVINALGKCNLKKVSLLNLPE